MAVPFTIDRIAIERRRSRSRFDRNWSISSGWSELWVPWELFGLSDHWILTVCCQAGGLSFICQARRVRHPCPHENLKSTAWVQASTPFRLRRSSGRNWNGRRLLDPGHQVGLFQVIAGLCVAWDHSGIRRARGKSDQGMETVWDGLDANVKWKNEQTEREMRSVQWECSCSSKYKQGIQARYVCLLFFSPSP